MEFAQLILFYCNDYTILLLSAETAAALQIIGLRDYIFINEGVGKIL